MFNNKSILITGGSGLFGRCFIETILRDYPEVKKIIIYSRDVQKQDEILALYPKKQFPQLRYFIGDVRDKERLIRACGGVDIIVHAATIASIEAAEYNPGECIKTNIIGAENVINAALKNNVHDVVALSSDKACAPSNLYGATQEERRFRRQTASPSCPALPCPPGNHFPKRQADTHCRPKAIPYSAL